MKAIVTSLAVATALFAFAAPVKAYGYTYYPNSGYPCTYRDYSGRCTDYRYSTQRQRNNYTRHYNYNYTTPRYAGYYNSPAYHSVRTHRKVKHLTHYRPININKYYIDDNDDDHYGHNHYHHKKKGSCSKGSY